MLIKELLLQEVSIPYYSILAVSLLIIEALVINHYLEKENENKGKRVFQLVTIAILASTFTTGIIFMSIIDSINNPKDYDLKPEFFSKLEDRAYFNYYNYEGPTNFFNPGEVEWLSDRFYQECDKNMTCFLNKSLAFVSKNIKYEEDIRQFGVREKHLRPLQTLSMERGDCEDIAFLLSSIIKNKWNKTYVVNMPGHSYTGVCWEGELYRYEGDSGLKMEADESKIQAYTTPESKYVGSPCQK